MFIDEPDRLKLENLENISGELMDSITGVDIFEALRASIKEFETLKCAVIDELATALAIDM